MQTIEFFVAGAPVGKQRPKFNSKQRRTYTPKKTADWEKKIKNTFKSLELPKIPEGTPISVKVRAFFLPPKSWPKYKRAQYMRDGERHTVKPDCDNVLKCVLDALNGVAYPDDSRVFSASVSKHYADKEGLFIKIDGCR